ncbi:MAG: carboxypeptidase-like regulatory domain-containing protein [Algoriphagus sp.]|uniref:carboxypeptidase-like regulatory domain-containing protein n=1 Tax=Algoriphagus sp. TaxID=1872435 RepID=UPI0027305594|nr:carboxypeptidase-like regulatory domain-containing protein [Algoriphagus sp.]MDP2041058.1 carboxypeptidase-like regulatory domain-containing protein [Algoriphagus sp.]MDP3470389.1 carboxypeptidase-like regulatory domain-containing protein [Algoriphagus sp.]
MNKNVFLTLFLFLGIAHFIFAQTGTLSGVVKDAETGETLPFCNVFINNTTISTVTDIDGKFILSNLDAGPLEIGFSFMGYVAETRKVTLNPGGNLTVNLSMKPFATELSDVEIKASRDKNWERDLRKFQNLFIGIDDAASKTKILNPWVIDFPVGADKGAFVAKADLPIEIENQYLGYKITFNLSEFFDSPTNYRIVGAARFEEMSPESEIQKSTWTKNRAEIYRKSPMNMFRSILNGTQEREGFFLYGDKAGGSASRNMRSDIFANELGNSVVVYKADPLVTPTSPPGHYFINLKGRIEIHYQKGFAQANTYKDAPYPISWLEVNGGKVKVKENGMVINPQDLVFSGDMDRKRISNLLPLDYNAEKAIQLQDLAKTAKNYQEKVYLHTDKPYYYAGDQVFFKGYFAYGNSYLRDELSKVLHVELVSGERDMVIEKKFQIRDGIVVGDFYLPDSLSGEKYFLRAYTNWMRNYGPNQYFLQPLSILDPYKRIVPEETFTNWKNQGAAIQADKTQFGTREKVTVTINVTNDKGKLIPATLSVGVWDARQLVPVKRTLEMANALNLQGVSENLGLDRFSYPIEKSLKLSGTVTDEKGKGAAAQVTAFVNDFQGMIDLESGSNGTFVLEDMEYFGPMKLAFSAMDKKGKPLKIDLSTPLKAPIALPSEAYFPKLITLAKPIRISEVEEELPAAKQTNSNSKPAIYGNPDFVVTGEELTKTGNTTDLVNSLAGNVPSMRVTLVGATGQQQIRIRGGAVSAGGSMEPLVMVNGAIMGASGASNAADNLRSINPFDIDRVEVVTRMAPMLGDQGRNGIIAVYLKDNLDMGLDGLAGPGIKEFLVEGFQPTGTFIPVDYAQITEPVEKDDRQTLYWNPYLIADEKGTVTFSFYTNDSDGLVVVEVRGLGIDGELIVGTFILNQK